MPGIKFNDDLHPVLTSGKDFQEVDGKERFEQILRFKALDRLYDILSEYNREEIPHKIKMEVSRIARQSALLDEIEQIDIREENGGSRYEIVVQYSRAEDFSFMIEQL